MEVDRGTGRLRGIPTVIPLAQKSHVPFVRDRPPHQFRKIFLKSGISSVGNGSAYIELEKTKVICNVFGPRESVKSDFRDKARLNFDIKYTTFATPGIRRPHIPDEHEKSIALILSESLESSVQLWKYPKTSIDVSILVIEDDGGVIPAAITCASLAIADAGIEMYDLVSSSSLVFKENSVLLDPSLDETNGSSGLLVVSYMSNRSEITHLSLSSKDLTSQQFSEALEMCIDGCEKIYRLMRECLSNGFTEKQKE